VWSLLLPPLPVQPMPLICLTHPTCHMLHPQECVAGSIMGGGLGLLILAFSSVWSGLDAQVGLTVAVALPVSCTLHWLCQALCSGRAAQAAEARLQKHASRLHWG